MRNLASYIDHTLLRPEAGQEDIVLLCEQAQQYGFKAVCVNPLWVPCAAQTLAASPVLVCSVVGFPLGASDTRAKSFEAQLAVEAGAHEVDMVIDIAAARQENSQALVADIAAVAAVAHAGGAILKVILETGFLNDSQKIIACQAAVAAGADFVKTCTGFSGGQATVEDVQLMRATVGDSLGVKASAGIRTREAAWAMIAAGATRVGASASVQMVTAE